MCACVHESVCVYVCVGACVCVKEVAAAAFLMGCVVYRGGLGNNSVTKGKSRRKTRTPPCPSMGQTWSNTHINTHALSLSFQTDAEQSQVPLGHLSLVVFLIFEGCVLM